MLSGSLDYHETMWNSRDFQETAANDFYNSGSDPI